MTVEEPEWEPQTTWFESQELPMTDLAGKIIDKPFKWGNEHIISALHTLPQGEQLATYFGLALAGTMNTLTPRIASKGRDQVRIKVVHA